MDFATLVGHEQGGRRPALVLSPHGYNAKVGLALVCPITSRGVRYPFEVALPSDSKIQGVVQADQIRSQDLKARKARPAGRVPETVVSEVVARLGVLLSA
jgi:mRNA interferase MazF